jgi:hypothetical protein
MIKLTRVVVKQTVKLTRKFNHAGTLSLASSAGLSKGSSLRIGFEKKIFWERGLP